MNFTLYARLSNGFQRVCERELEKVNKISLDCLLWYALCVGWKNEQYFAPLQFTYNFVIPKKNKAEMVAILFENVTSNVNHIHLFAPLYDTQLRIQNEMELGMEKKMTEKIKAMNGVLHVDYTCLRIIEKCVKMFVFSMK